jgi:hypothetical protein
MHMRGTGIDLEVTCILTFLRSFLLTFNVHLALNPSIYIVLERNFSTLGIICKTLHYVHFFST